MAKGMASFPLWLHPDVVSPTWQYGLVSVTTYDKDQIMAGIKGTLVNNVDLMSMALMGTVHDKKHDGHAQFQ